MTYVNWRKRLRGEPVKTILQPQLDDEGFYRKPITEKVIGANGHRNGQSRIIGWEPVAFYIAHGKLCGRIGRRELSEHEVNGEGLWSHVCRHPITEPVYRAVAERGEPWPDLAHKVSEPFPNGWGEYTELVNTPIIPADRVEEVRAAMEADPRMGHNKPPAVEPHIEHGEAILNAIKASRDLQVQDEESAATVLGAINRISELRLAATKAGKAIYQPIYQQYKTIMGQWTPMIEEADGWEKVLNKRYLTWRNEEKRKAAEVARIAAEENRRIEEANERAAQRAIAAGNPEPPPEVLAETPEPNAPAPVSATYRAAGQRTAPREVERWHLDGIDDYDAVYAVFKTSPELQAVLLKLSTAAIKNGQEVPGVRRHFGLI